VLAFIFSLLAAVRVFFRSRRDTALEILALRQQVAALKRKRPRPRLGRLDRWTGSFGSRCDSSGPAGPTLSSS
jgi:hypothetical protein